MKTTAYQKNYKRTSDFITYMENRLETKTKDEIMAAWATFSMIEYDRGHMDGAKNGRILALLIIIAAIGFLFIRTPLL